MYPADSFDKTESTDGENHLAMFAFSSDSDNDEGLSAEPTATKDPAPASPSLHSSARTALITPLASNITAIDQVFSRTPPLATKCESIWLPLERPPPRSLNPSDTLLYRRVAVCAWFTLAEDSDTEEVRLAAGQARRKVLRRERRGMGKVQGLRQHHSDAEARAACQGAAAVCVHVNAIFAHKVHNAPSLKQPLFLSGLCG